MELLKKLRISTQQPLYLINAPVDCLELFADVEVKEKLGKEKPVSQLILFVKDSAELAHYLKKLTTYIGHETLFWIAYPKKSGAISSDLVEMKNWDMVFSSGYRGQTSVSINDDWSSLRVTNAPPKKSSTYNLPPEERNIEGIDFVKRTVQLPADALAVLKKYKGMTEFFNAMAFTHKKEHVMAIVEAKKEETRKRRIDKMVEMLQQQMQAKKK